MSPISRRAYQLEKLREKILEIKTVIDGTIGNHSPSPVVLAMRAQVILIKNYIDEIKNMWSDYLTLANDTNIFITNTTELHITSAVTSYISSMLLLANNIPTINNSTTTRVLNLLKNISAVINGRYDGYSDIVKSLNSLIQIVEAIDNPRISRSSRSSRSSSRSSSSSPLSPLHPQSVAHWSDPPQFHTPDDEDNTLSLRTLVIAEGVNHRKKYRKIKTKKRRIKSTHIKPLTTNNSRKHRKTKIKKNN